MLVMGSIMFYLTSLATLLTYYHPLLCFAHRLFRLWSVLQFKAFHWLTKTAGFGWRHMIGLKVMGQHSEIHTINLEPILIQQGMLIVKVNRTVKRERFSETTKHTIRR